LLASNECDELRVHVRARFKRVRDQVLPLHTAELCEQLPVDARILPEIQDDATRASTTYYFL